MSSNDVILLKQLLSQRRTELAPDMSEADFFQIFAAEQSLKDRDLSYDELQDGIVDGGGDGGIDGVYMFVNNLLYREEIDPQDIKRNVPIELVFFQAKMVTGFSESGVEKFISSARDLLDLSRDLSTLTAVYKADLLGKINEFRTTYLSLTSKFPQLTIRYYIAALATEVHPNVQRKVEPLREVIQNLFSPVDFSCKFLRAQDLLALARRAPSMAYKLKLSENPISTGQQGFVCLVGLNDFCDFIRGEDGGLREDIFEGNVRDYQGNTEVNQQIRETLKSPTDEDFWWLNNGISVICESAALSGKILMIENPEIVNGLQTSREIFEVLSQRPTPTESRSVLVRVLVPDKEASRDRIIKATNSQTSIPSASLRATDKIHRDIEDYLGARGLYYDRRKNYYKNQGKPVKKIVSITFLAQAVLACALRDPGNARARPSSLLKRDETYSRIFSEDYPLDLYYKSAVLARKVEAVLRSNACSVDRSHWNNLRFYAAMVLALKLTKLPVPSIHNVADIDLNEATDETVLSCISVSWEQYSALGATDQVAKGNKLATNLFAKHRGETEATVRSQDASAE